MALREDEERLVRECIASFKRTIDHIQKQVVQLEDRLCKNDQIDLFDINFDMPVKKK